MSIHFTSHNRLEVLAEALFDHLFSDAVRLAPEQVFAKRDCVVVPSRIMSGWLRQYYLYDYAQQAASGGVIADCDFPLLNVFVNDWLYRMEHPGDAQRDPAAHPFAPESLQWRLFMALRDLDGRSDPDFRELQSFLDSAGSDPGSRDQRRFQLAARLAAVFDGYTVYRPELLLAWWHNRRANLPPNLHWQYTLWNLLTPKHVREKTYLAAFGNMLDRAKLAQCGIQHYYRAVHVFCPAIMPRVYQVFCERLAELLPIHLYLFNPSQTDWIVLDPQGRDERARAGVTLDAADEDLGLFARANPLLAGLGRGVHEFLAEWLEGSEGQSAEVGAAGRVAADAPLLVKLQQAVADNTDELGDVQPDGSIQVHICHHPRRELEVLRDHMLRWFTEEAYQPRDIQVLVPDMTVYAPYVEAVFGTHNKYAADTIPFVISDQVMTGANLVVEGFMRLLHLAESRFTAPEVVEMLQCDCMGRRFAITQPDVERIVELIAAAGIRWGRGVAHRTQVSKVDFTEVTSWRHGLDRLLKGYVLGTFGNTTEPESPTPCDCTEGSDALLLGGLARFVDELGAFADYCMTGHTLAEWTATLDGVVDDFFVADNESFRDVGMLRQAVAALAKSAEAAGAAGIKVEIRLVRAFLQTHLQNVAQGADVTNNAVVFSALRPGSSTPRKAICLLGMGDGAFPRQDNRPAYDLQKRERKRCDRTPRIDDRTAFLEALLSARATFYLSYPGFAESDNQSMPSSVLLRELLDFVGEQNCRMVKHRLQAFHPVYFQPASNSSYFSYSTDNCAAARQIVAATVELDGADTKNEESDPGTAENVCPGEIDLADLIRFFENPPRYYYQEVLGLRFEQQCSLTLPDQEEFEPQGLVEYVVRDAMIQAQTTGHAEDVQDVASRVYLGLIEQGMLPLGKWGRTWFDATWSFVESLLGLQLAGLGSLQEAWTRQMAGEQKNLLVDLATGSVYGTLHVFQMDRGPCALHFRSAAPNARTKITVWLQHVLASAAKLDLTSYCFEAKQGPKKLDAESLMLQPLASDTARQLLERYVALYMAGRRAVLRFTAKSSYAYASTLCNPSGKKQADDPAVAALQAALKAWQSVYMRRGEDADPYMLRAFGAEGPFAQEAPFAFTAKAFWEPYFACRENVDVTAGDT